LNYPRKKSSDVILNSYLWNTLPYATARCVVIQSGKRLFLTIALRHSVSAQNPTLKTYRKCVFLKHARIALVRET